jgi:hypothetical protein
VEAFIVAAGAEPITSGAVTVRNVQSVLEALGIEFLDHGMPGVRLRNATPMLGAAATRASKPARSIKKAGRGKTRPRGS